MFRTKIPFMILMAAAAAQAQTAAVPSTYQATYTQLQADLNEFDTAITSQWNGSRYPTLFSGELLTVNSNSGKALLQNPNVRSLYLTELNALKGLGMQAVTIKIGFPILYQPFLTYAGDPQDFAGYLSLYQGVVSDVHAAGMKVIVETTPLFPGFYSSNSGYDVATYFSSLSYPDFETGRATEVATIVQQIVPDYVNLGSEPDTEAKTSGFTQSNTASGWASAVTAYMSMVPLPHPMPIGAGAGTWLVNTGEDYINALVAVPNLDYLDLHIYPIDKLPNTSVDIVTNSINMITAAEAGGKPVGLSEVWLSKSVSGECNIQCASSDPTVSSRNAFSFWAPLDQQFVTTIWKLSNWKKLVFSSFFWSRYFWAYLDYNTVSSQTSQQIETLSGQTASSALAAGQSTSTATAAKPLASGTAPAIVSGASYSGATVAPNSIISLFGTGFSSGPATPTGVLPTNLGGVTATVTDVTGAQLAASLFYVSATQINALIPSNAALGGATITVTSSTGATLTGPITIAATAPGLFSANNSGTGTAIGSILVAHADGTTSASNAFTCSGSSCSPVPITVTGDPVYLTLYGTGIRGAAAGSVTATVGGVTTSVTYAGPQNQYSGLDQVNLLLPSSLAGKGQVPVQLVAGGVASNEVMVQIQ